MASKQFGINFHFSASLSVDNKEEIDTFCNTFIVEEHVVRGSLEHLINFRRTKAIRDIGRKRLKETIKNKKYNDYNWNNLVKSEENCVFLNWTNI